VRIVKFDTADGPRLCLDAAGELRPLDHRGAGRFEILGGRIATTVEAGVAGRLLAPVAPRKIVAIGLNYMDHIREAKMEPPKAPLLFTKFTSSLNGPTDPLVIDPELTARVDWEVELAVVIARAMKNVRESDALDYVLGYTVANDVSARDLQFADGQWVRGKSLDTFCPVGPCVVTPDEISDPQDLVLRTRVNGELVQDSSTREMVFGVAELLAYCSRSFTLEAGDVLLTGTPWGCGEFMSPPRSLQPGDVMETEIPPIGTLTNTVTTVAELSAAAGR